jgi:hypothetical protein
MEPTPTPRESPKLDIADVPEEKTDPGRLVSIGEMRHSTFVTRIIIGGAAAFVGAGGFAGVVAAASLVRTEARAQAKQEVIEQMKVVVTIDAGMKGIEARMGAVEQQVPQLRAEVYEQRLENRDIYRAIMERKRSDRLEGPPPAAPPRIDGGPP